MRWIILALSLGAFVMSMIHSVFVLFGFFPVSAGALPALPAWMVGGLTIVSAVLALIGGVIAFKRSRMGSVFLILAALLCVAAPTEFTVLILGTLLIFSIINDLFDWVRMVPILRYAVVRWVFAFF